MGHFAKIVVRPGQRKSTVILIVNVRMGPDVTRRPESVPASPDGRVRFVPSHVTREPLEQIVIQPVVAITTRPVTPRLARVSVQQGTSAKNARKSAQSDFTEISVLKNATVRTVVLAIT